jgi:hypothetical protein
MIHDVVSAVYKGGYRIEIEFDDGKRGVVDFSKYLARGGVFERFKDIAFFRNFQVNDELGVLTWDNEIDVAPETLYDDATGLGLPIWVEPNTAPPAANPRQEDVAQEPVR